MRGVHLKRRLKYDNKKDGVVVSQLLHLNQYLRQYYIEHYIRDVQVHNLKNEIVKTFS